MLASVRGAKKKRKLPKPHIMPPTKTIGTKQSRTMFSVDSSHRQPVRFCGHLQGGNGNGMYKKKKTPESSYRPWPGPYSYSVGCNVYEYVEGGSREEKRTREKKKNS